MASSKTAAAKGLDVNAWIDAGLTAILAGGLSAVAVEPLARGLGVTKGSFYWHFRDRNALLGAMVDRWGKTTEELIAKVAGLCEPAARLESLIIAVHRSPKGLRTMRAMSALAGHPAIGPRVRSVAKRQQTFLAQGFTELGLSAPRARAAAQLVHSATLGVGELEPLAIGFDSAAARQAYVEELVSYVRAVAATSKKVAPRRRAPRKEPQP